MKEAIIRVLEFFRNDFFPNLGYYLLQVFLFVLVVLIFAGINIVVRFITDPICIKVLRMKQEKRGPSIVGLFFTTVLTAVLLIISYASFPQLRPTVIGWMGEKLTKLVSWDRLPDLKAPAGYQPVPIPKEKTGMEKKESAKDAPPVKEPAGTPPASAPITPPGNATGGK